MFFSKKLKTQLRVLEEELNMLNEKWFIQQSNDDSHWKTTKYRNITDQRYLYLEKINDILKQLEKCHNILKHKIIIIISHDLTSWRRNNNLDPYKPQEVDEFMKKNDDSIEKVIQDMIDYYDNNYKVQYLENATFELIQEYLYKVLDTKSNLLENCLITT